MDWEYIYYTSGIMAVLLLILFGIYFLNNLRIYRRNHRNWRKMQDSIKVGKTIMFNGIFGKVVDITKDYLEVEISENVKVKISKYAVNKVLE